MSLFSINISVPQIYKSWLLFKKGKKDKRISVFEYNLEKNILQVYYEIINGEYIHGEYVSRKVFDPKERVVLVADIKDRLIHRIIYDSVFLELSKRLDTRVYSGIKNRGLYLCLQNIRKEIQKNNYNYFLKFDIQKFYESIDHKVLKSLLKRYFDNKLLSILENIISSSNSEVGVPLGNLTSQIFAQIYLNECDRYITHKLKIKNWYRYGDDYIFIFKKETELEEVEQYKVSVESFLLYNLKLKIHKIKILKIQESVLFLNTYFLKNENKLNKSTHKKFINRVNFKNHPTYKDIYKNRASKNQNKELFYTHATKTD